MLDVCRDGDFLVEILRRKIEAAKRRATPPRKKKPLPFEYEKQSLIAIASIYGVDLMMDNVLTCRERLMDIWNTEYEKICRNECGEECRAAVRFILRRNIGCGDALTLMCVDDKQQDTKEPAVFSEWTLPFNDTRIQRKDYTFAELLSASTFEEETRRTGQRNLFENDEGEVEPTFLKQYIKIFSIVAQKCSVA